MTKWQEVKLGDVAKFSQGKQIPIEEQYSLPDKDFVRFIRIIDYTNSREPPRYVKEQGDTYKVNNQDLVMIRYGSQTAGKVVRGISGIIANNMFKIETDNKKINVDFAYYFLSAKAVYKTLMGAQSSSTMPAITFDMIGNILFPLPPMDVQKKIAGVLGALDDKIELNNKINNNLEQQAQALFKSCFVDKEYEVERETTLGVVCKCELGGTPSRIKSEYWGGNIAWINSGEVNNFRITKASEYITEIGLKHSATKLLPRKTTVLAITGATLGQISLLEIDSCTNQSVVGVLENETLPYEFIYPYICYNIKELLSHQTGGAQQHINKQNVEQLTLSLPKSTLIKDYKNIVAPIFELIAKNCFESERLASLRDALLPKLMSGEIDVSNVDISALTSTDKLSFTEGE